MGDIWEILTTSNNLFAIFKVWPLQKQDKDDFKPNQNLVSFLLRRNARATF